MDKRVLMIAYYFPPDLDVGRIRTVKFCKYLPVYGWHPVVVVPKAAQKFGNVLSDEIADVTLCRVGSGRALSNLVQLGSVGKQWLQGLCHSHNPAVDAATNLTKTTKADRHYLRSLLYWPDLRMTWIPSAMRRAVSLARHCQAIYSSGWPMSCHLVALHVARLCGLPWIMDNRDPWILGTHIYQWSLQRRFMQYLDHLCVKQARYIVNVVEPRTKAHAQAYPDVPADKFVTIPNGIDFEDFINLPQPPTGGPIVLTYLGNLYGGRDPSSLIRTMAAMRKAGELTEQDMRVDLIGSGSDIYGEMSVQLGIGSMVRTSDRIPYRDAMTHLAASHVALLLLGKGVDICSVPTKVYEYSFLRKPTLVLGTEGCSLDLLAQMGAICVRPDDEPGIRATLGGLLRRHRSGHPPLPAMNTQTEDMLPSRKRTASLLAELLHEITSRHG